MTSLRSMSRLSLTLLLLGFLLIPASVAATEGPI